MQSQLPARAELRAAPGGVMTPQEFFLTELPRRIAANRALASEVNAVFFFHITGQGGGEWTVDLKQGQSVVAGDRGDSDCALECSAGDWQQIQESPQLATQLYFEGKLKVTGNVILATKLQSILAG
jgi:putative sterol carrier protein